MRLFGATHIDFMGKRRTWYLVSAVAILIGMASLAVKGISLGIDFLGGTELIVQFQRPVVLAAIHPNEFPVRLCTRVGLEEALQRLGRA